MLAHIHVKMDSISLFLSPYAKSEKILLFSCADTSPVQTISDMLLGNKGKFFSPGSSFSHENKTYYVSYSGWENIQCKREIRLFFFLVGWGWESAVKGQKVELEIGGYSAEKKSGLKKLIVFMLSVRIDHVAGLQGLGETDYYLQEKEKKHRLVKPKN